MTVRGLAEARKGERDWSEGEAGRGGSLLKESKPGLGLRFYYPGHFGIRNFMPPNPIINLKNKTGKLSDAG